MASDLNIERRARYRLKKHGMKLHKTKNDYGETWYQVLGIDDDPKEHTDDEYGWYKLNGLVDYMLELEEKDYLQRREQ